MIRPAPRADGARRRRRRRQRQRLRGADAGDPHRPDVLEREVRHIDRGAQPPRAGRADGLDRSGRDGDEAEADGAARVRSAVADRLQGGAPVALRRRLAIDPDDDAGQRPLGDRGPHRDRHRVGKRLASHPVEAVAALPAEEIRHAAATTGHEPGARQQQQAVTHASRRRSCLPDSRSRRAWEAQNAGPRTTGPGVAEGLHRRKQDRSRPWPAPASKRSPTTSPSSTTGRTATATSSSSAAPCRRSRTRSRCRRPRSRAAPARSGSCR